MVKYPHIKAKLTGQDGNAFNLMGIVTNALRNGKVPNDEVNKFLDEAWSGDYNHLLVTCTKWVSVS